VADPRTDVENLLRALAPQVLGVVARRHGDFYAAEDAVQEALLAAAQQWLSEGLPDNPKAWLIQVASRRLTDEIRSDIARRRREDTVFAQEGTDEHYAPAADSDTATDSDDTLKLLFMCCHSSLTPATAVALTLRAVGGLTTAEIANAFLVPEPTMAQRISRAKRTIRTSGVGFVMPTPRQWRERLSEVLSVLYLIFNEGYTSSIGESLQRRDLAYEAIRLTRLLASLLPDDREVTGLLALMLLTDARRHARSTPDGDAVPLQEQDRALWDAKQIAEGSALIEKAFALGPVGPYQLQAAIAALHDDASSTETTDWEQILALYSLLQRISPSPMVELNRAVAAAMVHGPSRGLAMLEQLDTTAKLAGHYRLDAVRAHLYEMAGDAETAVRHYRAAAAHTMSIPEQRYLVRKAARLAAH